VDEAVKQAPLSEAAEKGSGRGGSAARRRRNRLVLVALTLLAASLYGLLLDRRIHPDPFARQPGPLAWLSHPLPHPALRRLPVVPAGARGTLVPRPATTAWLNSQARPEMAPARQAAPPLVGPAEAQAQALPQQQQQQPVQQLQQPGPQQQQQQQQQPAQGIQQPVQQTSKPKPAGPPPGTSPIGAGDDSAAPLAAACSADGARCLLGGKGWIAVSTDGGRRWTTGRLGETAVLAAALSGGGSATLLLDDGTRLRRELGSEPAEWRLVPSEQPAPLMLAGFDSGVLWAVRGDGSLERLTEAARGRRPALSLGGTSGRRVLVIDATGAVGEAGPTRGDSYPVATGPAPAQLRLLVEVPRDAEAGSINGLWRGSAPAGEVVAAVRAATAGAPSGNWWAAGDKGVLIRLTVGENGTITDRQQVPTPTRANLRNVFFQDAEVGWASSGWDRDGDEGPRPVVLQSLDGGASWEVLRYRHLPAPWVWASLAGLVFAFYGAAVAHADLRQARPPRRSIADQAASDAPIGWEDRDVLGLQPIARALSKFLRNASTDPPVTFGITGHWGTGKSSLMNLVAEDLRDYGCRPVWFNAWHHQKEAHLLAALLENIRAQAIPPWWRLSGLGFRARLFWLRSSGDLLDLLALAFLVALAVGASWLLWLLSLFESWGVLTVWFDRLVDGGLEKAVALAAGGTVTLGASLLFAVKAMRRLRALPADPAALLAGLAARARIGDFRDQLGFRYRFAREFAAVCRILRTRRNPGVVIFVDDLDRCRAENVLEILEAVNFLVSAGPCFIFLGIDEEKVVSSVAAAFKDSVLVLPRDGETPDALKPDVGQLATFSRNYLEKLINIEIAVPASTAETAAALLQAHLPGTPRAAPAPPSPWPRRIRNGLGGLIDAVGGVVSLAFALVVTVAVASALLPDPEAVRPAPPEAAADRAGAAAPAPAAPAAVPQAPAAAPERPAAVAAEALGAATRWPLALLVLAPLLIVVALGLRRLLTVREDLVEDTDDFRTALGLWNDVIFAACPTPRAVKRYQNQLRFLAMRTRGDDRPLDWVERQIKRLGQRVREPDAVDRPELDEPSLVALGALDRYRPQLLEGAPEDIEAALPQALRGGLARFAETFPGAWPPTAQKLAAYLALSRALGAAPPQPAHAAPRTWSRASSPDLD
jgi:hypothetical protein